MAPDRQSKVSSVYQQTGRMMESSYRYCTEHHLWKLAFKVIVIVLFIIIYYIIYISVSISGILVSSVVFIIFYSRYFFT